MNYVVTKIDYINNLKHELDEINSFLYFANKPMFLKGAMFKKRKRFGFKLFFGTRGDSEVREYTFRSRINIEVIKVLENEREALEKELEELVVKDVSDQ